MHSTGKTVQISERNFLWLHFFVTVFQQPCLVTAAPTAWFVSRLYIRSNSPDTGWCAGSKKQTKKMRLSGPAHLLRVWNWPFLFLVLSSHNLYSIKTAVHSNLSLLNSQRILLSWFMDTVALALTFTTIETLTRLMLLPVLLHDHSGGDSAV